MIAQNVSPQRNESLNSTVGFMVEVKVLTSEWHVL